jgi:branched-chain amino acid transport system permease protein
MYIFSIPISVLAGQLMIGTINGAFYALLSLGLAVIFGMLNIVNFVHGAMYMVGAFVAWIMLNEFGLSYWSALICAPLVVAALGIVVERVLLRRVYKLDHIYGLLLTFGLTLVIEGVFRQLYGNAGQPYAIPLELGGGHDLGFMYLPNYRIWVIIASLVMCLGTWYGIERTRFGSYLRAATENPMLVRAFGIRVPRMIMLTYGFGAALAAFAGVMAAPIYQVSPLMGTNIIVVIFAVVVIGGMGSIKGAVISGFGLGIVESVTKLIYPEAATVVIFLVMAVVLLVKPAGLFGGSEVRQAAPTQANVVLYAETSRAKRFSYVGAALLLIAVLAPFLGLYSGFLMKALCFALFACAFNFLLGFGGLLSFGHAAFFGVGAYMTGFAMKNWSLTPELGLAVGVLASGALGTAFGSLAIRRQGIYFAMVTLALAQMVYFICVQVPFTGGEDGMRDIPRGKAFGFIDLAPTINMYFFVLAVFLLGFFVIYRAIHSPLGHVLKAIRENEPRALSLGYKTAQCKLIAFIISASMAGLAGGLKVLVFQIAALSDVHFAMSGEVVLMTLVGGLGTLLGPVVGAIFLISLEGYLAELGAWVTVVQGVIFIFCVLALRRGIVGSAESLSEQVRRLAKARARQAWFSPAFKRVQP